MPNQRKPKTDFEKELEREAKAYEPMFWLIPKWLRIISPIDVATRRELLEMELEVRQILHDAKGEEARWFQDTLYRMARYAWLYIWTALVNILGVVLIVAANVLWFWFLGWLLYIMFTD